MRAYKRNTADGRIEIDFTNLSELKNRLCQKKAKIYHSHHVQVVPLRLTKVMDRQFGLYRLLNNLQTNQKISSVFLLPYSTYQLRKETRFKPSLEILVSVTHRETVRYVVPLQKPVTDTSSSERSPWSPAPILPSKVS